MVIWIIGLSASGKTTLGRAVLGELKKRSPNTVFVDGDEVRAIFKSSQRHAQYTLEDRRENARRIFELCRFLDNQNINVVCCILSLFPKLRAQNRAAYSSYFEVYVKTPLAVAKKRDIKGVYAHKKNVAGIDIPFQEPQNPDFIFDNSKDAGAMAPAAREIVDRALAESYSYARGDLIAAPNTYFYSTYRGTEFLRAWKAQRAKLAEGVKAKSAPRPGSAQWKNWKKEPIDLRSALEGAFRSKNRELIDRLAQKFEVEKRWHTKYGPRLKTFQKDNLGDCRDHSLYIRAAELFEREYCETGLLPYLNVFCKSLDTISSFFGELSAELKSRAVRLIRREAKYIEALIA